MVEISVVVVSYNESPFLKRGVSAILNQSYEEFELIFVDDCSTDNTEKIIKSFNDSRIKYFKNHTNKGIAFSRNRAIENVSGDYVFFTDGDCIPNKYWIEEGINILKKEDCIGTYGKLIYEDCQTTISDRCVQNLHGKQFNTANIAYKKDIFNKLKFQEKYGNAMEDEDFRLRVKNFGKIIFNEDMLVIHQKKCKTPKIIFKDLKNYYKSNLLLFKEHKRGPIFHRILLPRHLLLIFLPFLIPIFYSFKSPKDIINGFALYFSLIITRFYLWGLSIKNKVFLV